MLSVEFIQILIDKQVYVCRLDLKDGVKLNFIIL